MKRRYPPRVLNFDDPVEYLAPPHLAWWPYNYAPETTRSTFSTSVHRQDPSSETAPNVNHPEKDERQLPLPFEKEGDDE